MLLRFFATLAMLSSAPTAMAAEQPEVEVACSVTGKLLYSHERKEPYSLTTKPAEVRFTGVHVDETEAKRLGLSACTAEQWRRIQADDTPDDPERQVTIAGQCKVASCDRPDTPPTGPEVVRAGDVPATTCAQHRQIVCGFCGGSSALCEAARASEAKATLGRCGELFFLNTASVQVLGWTEHIASSDDIEAEKRAFCSEPW